MEKRSGTRKEPKPQLLSLDIFRWAGGLPRKRVGAKKFGMSLETKETKLFWRDISEFCQDIPGAPEEFEKKCLCLIFGPEKRGRKTSRMTPLPKRGLDPSLVRYVFHPSQVSVLCFFLYKNPRQGRTEALLEGSRHFRESAFSGTFSSPHTFWPPHITAQRLLTFGEASELLELANFRGTSEFLSTFTASG